MPESTSSPTPPADARGGRANVIYWCVAGLVYIALGVAFPPAFLLGFQESALYVFLVTFLQPKILRRFR